MLALSHGMRRQGIDVTIGCPAQSPIAEAAGSLSVPVIGIEKQGAMDLRAIRRMVKVLKTDGFDLIHAHNGRTAWLAAIARCFARQGVLVSTMHFIDPARSTRRGLKRFAGSLVHRFVRSQTVAVIAISDVVRDAAIRRGDINKTRIHRVYNGVTQPSTTMDREAARDSLELPHSMRVLITATRLQKEKSVPILIEAVNRLRERGVDNFKLLIVGSGSLHDELLDLIMKLGLSDWIKLLGFRKDVHDLMLAGDVLIHPASAEPFGLVLTEAMALGLPVIASDGGAAPEIVENNKTGLIFRAGDSEDLCKVIEQFLSEPAEVQDAMGRDARARYQEHFTSDRMAVETAEVYRKALQMPSNMPHHSTSGAV
jgi:glycosyltransferase involved in cell wall biosynthesis